MAKISFTKLAQKFEQQVKTIKIKEQDIEVKQNLSSEKKF